MEYVYEPHHEKYVFGFLTRSDINQTVQQQKLVGGCGWASRFEFRKLVDFYEAKRRLWAALFSHKFKLLVILMWRIYLSLNARKPIF